ncbi:MAG: hypothetical protein V3575_06865 [Candidatus Absconditabacteria bacterium]
MNFPNHKEIKSNQHLLELDIISISILSTLEGIFEPYGRYGKNNVYKSYKFVLQQDFSNEMIILSQFTSGNLTGVSIEDLLLIHLSIFNIIEILKDLDFLYGSISPQFETLISNLKVMSNNLKYLGKHDFLSQLGKEIICKNKYFEPSFIIADILE